MKIARKKLIEMITIINRLPMIKNVKVAYALSKNKRTVLSPILESMNEASKPSDKFLEFERKRHDLCHAHAKDANGAVQIENGNYIINTAQKEQFEEAISALQKEYADTLTAHVEQQKNIQKFLDEEEEVEFHKIDIDLFAAAVDSISVAQMDILSDMLE